MAPKLILPEWVPTPERDGKALGILETLAIMMAHASLCSRRWITEQYDSLVGGNTLSAPAIPGGGGDAAIVRLQGKSKGIAITCDVTPRYVAADPRMGTCQAVAETYRNLCAVGADPIAITDNLNFGNPERPIVMGQIVGAIEGMGEACRVLDYPVVSGNVSLYNETKGVAIPPTPAIGGVGLVPDVAKIAGIGVREAGLLIIAIGREHGHLGQSLYQQIMVGKLEGAPPPVDLADEIKGGTLIRQLIREGHAKAVHDVSDGGLLVALAEMALSGGIKAGQGMGLELFPYEGRLPHHAIWFGEDQGRYLVACKPAAADMIMGRARLLALPARIVARTGGTALTLKGEAALAWAELRAVHEATLPRMMGVATAR